MSLPSSSLPVVMLGGAIGAGARHLAGRGSLALLGPGYPYATLVVNLVGGFLMGVLAGALTRGAAGEVARLFLGVGVLGGFTTFSAFSLDAVTLAQRGQLATAAGYVVVSVAGSIAALLIGLAVTRVTA